jgi:hypothetical protein
MAAPLTVYYDETALSLFRRVESTPLKTGLAALDKVQYLAHMCISEELHHHLSCVP